MTSFFLVIILALALGAMVLSVIAIALVYKGYKGVR
jgi:hypothetical protein